MYIFGKFAELWQLKGSKNVPQIQVFKLEHVTKISVLK